VYQYLLTHIHVVLGGAETFQQ